MNEILEYKSIVPKETNDLIDAVEYEMINSMVGSGEFKLIDLPVKHTFTPGLYSREITMYAGNYITSKIHLTEHQFVISKGKVTVYSDNEEVTYEAPYSGITKAGTRRILYIHSDCTWTTFHANPNNLNEIEIEDLIIEKHENKLLTKNIKL